MRKLFLKTALLVLFAFGLFAAPAARAEGPVQSPALVSGQVSGQVPGQLSEDDSFKAKITADPKGERPRYDYAFYLYTKKRFKEAREQLGFLYALSAEHEGARKLTKSMDELDGLKDAEYQDQQIRIFMLQKMEAEKKLQIPTAKDGSNPSLTPERKAHVKKDLDRRYDFTSRLKAEVKLVGAELQFQTNLWNAQASGDFDRAEKIARSWTAQFDKSPIAKADFAAFLVGRGRFPQAEVLLNSGLQVNPDCLKLRIVSDVLKEMKLAKSSEKTKELRERLIDELSIYSQMINVAK